MRIITYFDGILVSEILFWDIDLCVYWGFARTRLYVKIISFYYKTFLFSKFLVTENTL